MENLLKYFTLMLLVLLMGCSSKEEPDAEVKWDTDAAALIKDGIYLNYDQETLTLNFTCSLELPMATQSDVDWLSPTVDFSNGNGRLNLSADINLDYTERVGNVSLTVGNKTTHLKVYQGGLPQAITEESGYEVNYDSRSISIPVKANGTITAVVVPSNCDWVKVAEITKDTTGDDDYAITLSLEENAGFGRIAAIELEVDKSLSKLVYILQKPAPFSEEVTIEVAEPGMLQVLMGNVIENLRRIRRLTIKGSINGLDLPVVKKLFMEDEKSVVNYPVSIDLSDCWITTDPRNNPYERFGWKPSESWHSTDADVTAYSYGTIPYGLFTKAANLTAIVLPDGETRDSYNIEHMAFSGCTGLKSIDIPYLVKEIGNRAFQDCPNLTEINIPINSLLNTLGDEVFDTGSVIESLSLPEILIYISEKAFSGCRVKNLHVHWFHHIEEVEIVPETEGCTLYVPEGTADIYRVTPNWCNFQNIVEEPYTPYE